MEALTPNWTLGIHLVLFVVVYGVLKVFLFDPYLDVLERRHAAAGGAGDSLDAERAAIDAMHARVEAELSAARERARTAADQVAVDAVASADAVIAQATATAEAEVRAAGAELAAAETQINSALSNDLEILAKRAADRMLESAA